MNKLENGGVMPLWIGMPVYNSRKTIAQSLDSLLAQSFGDFILFISDNASIDGTSAIIQSYAARDSRIRYIRQAKNQGAAWNFSLVLHQANTEYFMWAAGDDYWAPDFIKDNVENLTRDPRAVLSVSRTAFVHPDGSLHPVLDTRPLTGDAPANILAYVANPASNSRFYGIHRLLVIQKAFRAGFGSFLASDWAVMAHSLRAGSHVEVERLQMFRHTGGASANFMKLLKPFRQDFLGFFFPMARYSIVALRVGKECRNWRVPIILFRINAHYALVRFVPIAEGKGAILRTAISFFIKHMSRSASSLRNFRTTDA